MVDQLSRKWDQVTSRYDAEREEVSEDYDDVCQLASIVDRADLRGETDGLADNAGDIRELEMGLVDCCPSCLCPKLRAAHLAFSGPDLHASNPFLEVDGRGLCTRYVELPYANEDW